jgi:hypothetical protein
MCREFGLPPIGLRIKRALRSDRKTVTVIPATAFFYRKANQAPRRLPTTVMCILSVTST